MSEIQVIKRPRVSPSPHLDLANWSVWEATTDQSGMGNARLLESASRSTTSFMGEGDQDAHAPGPAAAEAGLSASSTAAPVAFGCGAGVAAGAAGAAVLQPASAKKIPKRIEETN